MNEPTYRELASELAEGRGTILADVLIVHDRDRLAVATPKADGKRRAGDWEGVAVWWWQRGVVDSNLVLLYI